MDGLLQELYAVPQAANTSLIYAQSRNKNLINYRYARYMCTRCPKIKKTNTRRSDTIASPARYIAVAHRIRNSQYRRRKGPLYRYEIYGVQLHIRTPYSTQHLAEINVEDYIKSSETTAAVHYTLYKKVDINWTRNNNNGWRGSSSTPGEKPR